MQLARRKAKVKDLPESIENAVFLQSPRIEFPEPLTYPTIQLLQKGEFIVVQAKDADGAFRTMSGDVVSNAKGSLRFFNYALPAFAVGGGMPEVITIRDREAIYVWGSGRRPVVVRHPSGKELERLTLHKSQAVVPSLSDDAPAGFRIAKKFRQLHEAEEEMNTEEVVVLTAKEIAVKLLQVIQEEPRGSKALMREAVIDEDYTDVVKLVLKKLAEVGKIKKVKGDTGVRWACL